MPLDSNEIADMVDAVRNFVIHSRAIGYEPFSKRFKKPKEKRYMKILKTITTHVVFAIFVLSLLLNYFLYRACEAFRYENQILRSINSIQAPGPVLPPQIHRLPKKFDKRERPDRVA